MTHRCSVKNALRYRKEAYMTLNQRFRKFSVGAANAMGTSWMFVGNIFLILVWLGSGPLFHFSDTWQLVVNTATSVITYLAVFLIQNTQNRDAKAMHIKLDELISSIDGARNKFVDLQSLSDEELEKFQKQFKTIQAKAVKGDIKESEAIIGEISERKRARKPSPRNKKSE